MFATKVYLSWLIKDWRPYEGIPQMHLMTISVSYSLQKEVLLYLNTVYKFRLLSYGRKKDNTQFPPGFTNALKSAKNSQEATKIITSYLKSRYHNNRKIFDVVVEELEKYLNKNIDQMVSILENNYQREVPFKKIHVFLGTGMNNPYNYKGRWMMVGMYHSLEYQFKIILHELNHFMFYFYYSHLQAELGMERFESLKESLTVFTDPEEQGYPDHQQLRQWLKKQKGTIPEIIEKGEWKKYL